MVGIRCVRNVTHTDKMIMKLRNMKKGWNVMGEWKDFCEGLDDDERLLAEVYEWIGNNILIARSDRRLSDIYANIAKRLNIR